MKQLAQTGAIDADLASAFDASPNPYMMLTPDLRYAAMNDAYVAAVGLNREAMLGRPIFEVFDAGPTAEGQENQKQLRESFERVLRTGRRDHLALIRYAMPRRTVSGETVMEDRFWSATHTPVQDGHGAVAYILQHTNDITELELLRRRFAGAGGPAPAMLDTLLGGNVLARAESVQADNRRLEGERNRLIDMFMQAPGFVAVLTGREQTIAMHNPAYGALVGRDDVSGQTVRHAMPELEGQGYHELLDHVFDSGEPYEGRAAAVTFIPPGARAPRAHYVDFIYQPIRDPDGGVAGIFVQGHDVTETVIAAERQKLMIDELNHRVKNTLATVQSIAMQTARSHQDPRTFAEAFQARLLALSHTHNLLTQSHWEGADLHDILRHETEAHGPLRVSVNGPPVALDPAQALSLGMVFHELATNAAKYGALSSEHGRVLVDWTVGLGDEPKVRVHWRETDGPTVSPPERRGFGGRLIERNIRHDLAGEIKLDYASEGVTADFVFPLRKGKQA